ncbi:MAG: YraN family protein, partial [bacterium]|nr:YraN family protein [bacterium]
MQSSHLALGAEGEARAARHLTARGWRILARNARCDGVEIDLIASRAGVLAFVEVKTRRTRSAGMPEEAIDARKRARLVRGAAAWLRDHRTRARVVRFDVLVVEPGAEGWLCRHLPGAFDAG